MSLKLTVFTAIPRERGQQQGELMRSEIAANADFYLKRFCANGTNLAQIQAEATGWLRFLEDLRPDYVEELRGIADAAFMPLYTVVMLNVRHEIWLRLMARRAADLSYGILDGCTSAGLMPEVTAQNTTMLAQTIDGQAAVRGTLFVGKVVTPANPQWLGIFEAGCAGPIAGLNEAGIGLVCNSLVSPIDGSALMTAPFKLRCRSILQAPTFDRAISAIIRADRNISMNYLIGHADGEIINIESSPNDKRYIYPEDGVISHANHFEPGTRIPSEWERFVPDSPFRSRRFGRHLRSRLGQVDVDHILLGLKDHFSYPASICCHPNQDTQYPNSTLSAIIMDLSKRVLFATDGPPCSAPLERFDLWI
ncbi:MULTISPECIES: C45 family autoproteolytic acyltransferase/hydolase [Bradyrhizobium]|nr:MULTISPECIES: C45 family peptidase [Bradyrhizobium]MCG2633164.1 C45 family peptidase [Bradyrhizobium zhengyangense]MCG2645650.1 C45 family peptidase [Bradyrhizobium zhengyangense]MCG2673258.1 C45 family peptidase [Bradyrhizobium zhengyangense]MDN4985355.1 C45 family autoproteolytic acyltransferase/hydrolase [Bradyrhizobium sp. WYCCWR 13022]MDN5006327.1 C45 family autoproteolytic acyltransferase/hydrolase [Bradyrhizobium sp. WYCCWR 12677]